MSKEINFKIIELEEYQVLLSKDYDEDEESTPMLTITFFVYGIKAYLKLRYNKEKGRDKHFENFNEVDAQLIVNETVKMIK